MRLFKGVLYAGLASAILFAVSAPAKAAGVPVFSDLGLGLADVTGTASGATVASVPATNVTLVNGSLPTPDALTLSIAENITGFTSVMPGLDMITSGTGTKIILDPTTGEAIRLDVKIESGFAGAGFMTVNGVITTATVVGGTGLPDGYNFANLIGGITTITDNQTTVDFTTVLGHTAVTANGGALSVTESIPEPTSMALLGVGMAGFFAYRRFFKRHATA
jgi:hypothetical protein